MTGKKKTSSEDMVTNMGFTYLHVGDNCRGQPMDIYLTPNTDITGVYSIQQR